MTGPARGSDSACRASTYARTAAGMLQVRGGDDILLVTTKGKVIRIHADEVSSQGRNTMGVRIIELDADDRVGSVARVEAESPAPAEAT